MKKTIITMLMLIAGMSGIVSVDAQDYDASASKVWICVSPNAKRYHRDYDCKGLQSCKHDIIEVSVAEAQDRGLTKCKMCYD